MPTTPSTSPSTAAPTQILLEPLTPHAFAPFGEVIQNPRTHHNSPTLANTQANQGSAEKWLDITSMQDWYGRGDSGQPASLKFNMFVCYPRSLEISPRSQRSAFCVRVLERHPFTPQTFIPIGLGTEDTGTCYLVIVAPTLPLGSEARHREDGKVPGPQPQGPGLPDLTRLRAFFARGDQALTYGAGTWHAPMVVVGVKAVEFVVVQYMNGVAAEDCQEMEVRGGVEVEVGDVKEVASGNMGRAEGKARL
ncbi:hypothetical protein B0A50_01411 [Salinomyces thailandicus]|uniref:Ureidoglycolate hydrolase n=1 Tax=Salinomyces thailandicus TaxID=706561 RepID=A0A4U0U9Y2_9PEZI|nr:hypothetical protein B0A50_01411 [Salinomyces thailandica]